MSASQAIEFLSAADLLITRQESKCATFHQSSITHTEMWRRLFRSHGARAHDMSIRPYTNPDRSDQC